MKRKNVFENQGVTPPKVFPGKQGFEYENINVLSVDQGDGDICVYGWSHNTRYAGGRFVQLSTDAAALYKRQPNVLRIDGDDVSFLSEREVDMLGQVRLRGEIYSNFKRCPGERAQEKYRFEDGRESKYSHEDLMAMSFACLLKGVFAKNCGDYVNTEIIPGLRTIVFVGRPSNDRWAQHEREYQQILMRDLKKALPDEQIDVIVISEAMAAFAKHVRTGRLSEVVLTHDSGSSTTDGAVINTARRCEDGEASRTFGGRDLDGCLLVQLEKSLNQQYGTGWKFENPAMMRIFMRQAKERYFGDTGMAKSEHRVVIPILLKDGGKTNHKFFIDDDVIRAAIEETPFNVEAAGGRYAQQENAASWKDAYIQTCREMRNRLFGENSRPDRLIITGGVSRMPQVRLWVQQVYGVEPEMDDMPHNSVAYGLIYMAATEIRKHIYLEEIVPEVVQVIRNAPGFHQEIEDANVESDWNRICNSLKEWAKAGKDSSLQAWHSGLRLNGLDEDSCRGLKNWYEKNGIGLQIEQIMQDKFHEMFPNYTGRFEADFSSDCLNRSLEAIVVNLTIRFPGFSGDEWNRVRSKEGDEASRQGVFNRISGGMKRDVVDTLREGYKEKLFLDSCKNARKLMETDVVPALESYVDDMTPYFISGETAA